MSPKKKALKNTTSFMTEQSSNFNRYKGNKFHLKLDLSLPECLHKRHEIHKTQIGWR